MQIDYTASALFAWPGGVQLVLGAVESTPLVANLMPFFKGEPGGMTTEEVQAQIEAGLAEQTYDYDALLAATLTI